MNDLDVELEDAFSVAERIDIRHTLVGGLANRHFQNGFQSFKQRWAAPNPE